MIDWRVVAELSTAGGTLVLAVATFASVSSARRTARATERAVLAGLRPLLLPSRLQDPPEKIGFADEHWVHVLGGHGSAEATDEAIYFAITLRNAGQGFAVLRGWTFSPERLVGADVERPDPDTFRRLTRDLYIPPGDLGFWQGALRDTAEPVFAEAAKVIANRQTFTIDILYGDNEGGQRVVTRFTLIPRNDGSWLTAVSRHWHMDRDDPR